MLKMDGWCGHDVAQQECNNNICYASAFRYIQIQIGHKYELVYYHNNFHNFGHNLPT